MMKEGYEYVNAVTNNPKVIGFYLKHKGQIIHSFTG